VDIEKALSVNKDEIERILSEVDKNGDGNIDFEEFSAMMFKEEDVLVKRQELADEHAAKNRVDPEELANLNPKD
jgi:hypothetical protein